MSTNYIHEKYRSERSREVALVCSITEISISAVYYDLSLERRIGRSICIEAELALDTLMYQLRMFISSSMEAISIVAEDVKKICFGAPAAFSTLMLLQYDSPEDYLLKEDAELLILPNINTFATGGFTASLASAELTEGTAMVEIAERINMVWLADGNVNSVSYPLAGAFAGIGLSSGILDEKGAIDDVWIDNDKTLCYSVEGDGDSCGISASGAVSALSAMIENGIVDPDGIMTDRDMLYVGEDYFVSQADVRLLQSDKAMTAAVLSLLPEGCRVYFSGEVFAANGMKALRAMGAVPPEMAQSAGFCRSASEQGMINILTDNGTAERIYELCDCCNDVSAQLQDRVDEQYIENLGF